MPAPPKRSSANTQGKACAEKLGQQVGLHHKSRDANRQHPEVAGQRQLKPAAKC